MADYHLRRPLSKICPLSVGASEHWTTWTKKWALQGGQRTISSSERRAVWLGFCCLTAVNKSRERKAGDICATMDMFFPPIPDSVKIHSLICSQSLIDIWILRLLKIVVTRETQRYPCIRWIGVACYRTLVNTIISSHVCTLNFVLRHFM